MENLTLKQLIKDNKVYFSHYRKGVMYYQVSAEDQTFLFPVPLQDNGDATLMREDKAIFFMRYIRKAMNNNELVLAA